MTTNALETRRDALLARTSTATLIESARALDEMDGVDERQSLVWVINELERRYPATDAMLDAWCESDAMLSESYATAVIRFIGELDAESGR